MITYFENLTAGLYNLYVINFIPIGCYLLFNP